MFITLLVTSLLTTALSQTVYQTEPRRAIVRRGGSVSIIGRGQVPLSDCTFYYHPNTAEVVDLSAGPLTPSTDEYEYYGAGLDRGECGITLKKVKDTNDGIVESKIKAVGKDEWQSAATTLRVTNLPASRRPVFEIHPKRVTLRTGDSVTVTCNADRAITMCHIFLPGGHFLNFDKGAGSVSTPEHRYHGDGLSRGHCGVTLAQVDESLTGYVVCKVGMWPDSVVGPWETDVLTVTISDTEPVDFIDSQEKNDNVDHRFTELSKAEELAQRAEDEQNCGRKNAHTGQTLVSGGVNAQIEDHPWHAGIYVRLSDGNFEHLCGATIVTRKHVITAAHCFWSEKYTESVLNNAKYKIAVGKYNRRWSIKDPGEQRLDIASIRVHPRFSGRRGLFKFDIAIVELQRSAVLTSNVNTICIDWNNDFDVRQLSPGNVGTVTGWGNTAERGKSDVLQSVRLPYVSEDTCLDSLPADTQRYVTTDKFCAGSLDGKGAACPGDSGGGIVFLNETVGRQYLRGIVSVSFRRAATKEACFAEQYTGYTLLSDYLDKWGTLADVRGRSN